MKFGYDPQSRLFWCVWIKASSGKKHWTSPYKRWTYQEICQRGIIRVYLYLFPTPPLKQRAVTFLLRIGGSGTGLSNLGIGHGQVSRTRVTTWCKISEFIKQLHIADQTPAFFYVWMLNWRTGKLEQKDRIFLALQKGPELSPCRLTSSRLFGLHQQRRVHSHVLGCHLRCDQTSNSRRLFLRCSQTWTLKYLDVQELQRCARGFVFAHKFQKFLKMVWAC